MTTVPTTATLMLLAASTLASAQGFVQKAAAPIPGQYIVVLADEALPQFEQATGKRPEVRELAAAVADDRRFELRRTFAHAVNGFVARMSESQAEALAAEPWVASVEEDGLVEVAGTQDAPPSWGLDRVDQRPMTLDFAYAYASTGSGVDVYIVDSGIRASHVDFGGRVDTVRAFTAINDGYGTSDPFGHGTMVAGIVAGATYGVAKAATLHPVRVVDATGSASISTLVAGIDWVTQQFTSQVTTTTTTVKGKTVTTTTGTRRPAVINISLITSGSLAVNTSVNTAITAGITVVAAAGNSALDACGFSPAGIANVITVGASNDADNAWVYSNGGTCVDIFAPGVLVSTTLSRSDTDFTPSTGTSVAAPHVAGAAALVLAANPAATPAQVASTILSAATTNALAALPAGSPNRLLYTAALGQDQPPTAAFSITVSRTTVTFDASASSDDKGIASYAWSFGDGTSGSGAKVSHKYALRGSYAVTLTVKDAAGHTTSITRSAQI